MIDILHIERNKVVVSSHVKSSLYLFHVLFNLRCLNSLWTALVHVKLAINYEKLWNLL